MINDQAYVRVYLQHWIDENERPIWHRYIGMYSHARSVNKAKVMIRAMDDGLFMSMFDAIKIFKDD